MPYRNGQIVKWKVSIKGIRNLFSSNDSDEEAKRVGKEIHKIITSNLYKKYFKGFGYQDCVSLNEFLKIESCEHLNNLLVTFYDYCDVNLIWIDMNE